MQTVQQGSVQLSTERRGDLNGQSVVLLHGLSSTSRYVTMGSNGLERDGYDVIAYDARGHGESSAAAGPADYSYSELVDDLLAVMDQHQLDKATLVGVSMGAHTAARATIEHPERVAGLVLITPAFDPDKIYSEQDAAHWHRLAAGLREGGIDGFLAAYPMPEHANERMRSVLQRAIRQRLAQHNNLDAVADALEGVPQSRPIQSRAQLETVAVPTTVIASRDDLDAEHPQVVAELWESLIPEAELAIEQEGESPLAWRGGRIVSAVQQTCSRIA